MGWVVLLSVLYGRYGIGVTSKATRLLVVYQGIASKISVSSGTETGVVLGGANIGKIYQVPVGRFYQGRLPGYPKRTHRSKHTFLLHCYNSFRIVLNAW